MTKRKALITGITGMDGSYLAEFLLNKGYEVHGVIRRTSSYVRQRIDHLTMDPTVKNKTLFLHYGDMTDGSNISRIIEKIMPDEVYNLAAQSHVKISFDVPEYSAQVDGIGTIRLLDAIKSLCPGAKFYQASTSELFGQVQETPQKETTPFYPRSPYAAAKLYAYWITVNYREAYGLFACNGILFNHETLTYGNPLIIKDSNDDIDILPIGDIARFHTGLVFNLENKSYQEGSPISNLEVWDNNRWTKVIFVSGYPHEGDKDPRIINARNGVYMATASHKCIMEDSTNRCTRDLVCGDKIWNIEYPSSPMSSNISAAEAEMLGMLVADGHIRRNEYRFTNKDMRLKKHFVTLWSEVVADPKIKFYNSTSGFNGSDIGYVACYGKYPGNKDDIYTCDINIFGHRNKKIPKSVLNAPVDIMRAFLVGYNNGDGLKANRCTYEFKNFKTNSPTLAAGLLFLVSKVTGQEYNITVEESWAHNKQQFYYSINLLSDAEKSSEKYKRIISILDKYSQREISRQTGISRSFIRKIADGYTPSDTHYLKKVSNEIKKIIDIPGYSGWFFDLETESGTFHAGIGQALVHNSERRGENFVTKKITVSAARIAKGLQQKVSLGNLAAKRDWGYAPDYVEGMWLMLQQDEPQDIILATGENHSVEEFCTLAFDHVGVPLVFEGEGAGRKGIDKDGNIRVDVSQEYFRPTEVETLLGDPTKAKEVLGWEPKTTFEELVRIMVEHDIKGA